MYDPWIEMTPVGQFLEAHVMPSSINAELSLGWPRHA